MTFRIRRILVAIRDVPHAPRSQLLKAAALARSAGASLELFHAINEPIALDVVRRGNAGQSARRAVESITQRSQRDLERLAQSSLLRGPKVRTLARWDYPPHEAIVRRALATRADLVIAATQPHRLAGRLLLTNTDWELIRQCPCAVLLVKTLRSYRNTVVLAAVDPFHAHAKPAALDERILDAGATLARTLRGELHAFHAYMPLTVVTTVPMGHALAVSLPPEFEDMHTAQVQSVFDGLAQKAGIPHARRHLRMGDVPGQLAGVVKRTKAGIVVMGAVSRSALRRVFIGSTAETVVDALSCDVLIVKPRGFKSQVPKRPNDLSRSR